MLKLTLSYEHTGQLEYNLGLNSKFREKGFNSVYLDFSIKQISMSDKYFEFSFINIQDMG